MYRLLPVLLVALGAHLAQAALPFGWKACKMASPDYKQCLARQFEFAVGTLKNGNKKLGINPIDPLSFKTLDIDQSSGPVQIKLAFRDFTFQGLSKVKITDIQNDWKEMTARGYFNEIVTKGAYKINGKVLILPIQGDGPCTLVWHNMTVEVKLQFKEVEKKGKKAFEVSQFFVDIHPKKLTVKFENLFNGNKAMGDNMNLFLNENWEEITNELKPSISKGLSQGFQQVSNQVFSKLSRGDFVQ